MTEENPDDTPAAAESSQSPASEPDYMLQVFAQQVASEKLEKMGLTLSLGGTMLSGMLINRNTWFDLLVEGSASDDSEPNPFMAGIRDAMHDEPDDVPEDLNAYGYLHLSEVRFITSQGAVPTNTLWRVRISEVSGWSFQLLS